MRTAFAQGRKPAPTRDALSIVEEPKGSPKRLEDREMRVLVSTIAPEIPTFELKIGHTMVPILMLTPLIVVPFIDKATPNGKKDYRTGLGDRNLPADLEEFDNTPGPHVELLQETYGSRGLVEVEVLRAFEYPKKLRAVQDAVMSPERREEFRHEKRGLHRILEDYYQEIGNDPALAEMFGENRDGLLIFPGVVEAFSESNRLCAGWKRSWFDELTSEIIDRRQGGDGRGWLSPVESQWLADIEMDGFEDVQVRGLSGKNVLHTQRKLGEGFNPAEAQAVHGPGPVFNVTLTPDMIRAASGGPTPVPTDWEAQLKAAEDRAFERALSVFRAENQGQTVTRPPEVVSVLQDAANRAQLPVAAPAEPKTAETPSETPAAQPAASEGSRPPISVDPKGGKPRFAPIVKPKEE